MLSVRGFASIAVSPCFDPVWLSLRDSPNLAALVSPGFSAFHLTVINLVSDITTYPTVFSCGGMFIEPAGSFSLLTHF